MLIPVLAGLGALSLLSNPPRRRRRKAKRRNPKKAKRESRLAAFLRERDFSRKLGLSQAEIDADMGNIARERRRRQAAKRRNPSKISRTSLTEAEEMIGNRAMLADKRQHAWVMSKKNAQTVSRQLKHGFHRVESTHRGARGEKLYLVTDGHWFVADTHPHATGGRYAHASGAARRRLRAARKASNPRRRRLRK